MRKRFAAAGRSAVSLVYLAVVFLALLCATSTTSANDGEPAAEEYPSLAGTVWKQVLKGEYGGKYMELPSYVRFFDDPWVVRDTREENPIAMKKMMGYPYQKNESMRHITPRGWQQEGRQVGIYKSTVNPYRCEFVDASTIRGSVRSMIENKLYEIELTRVDDPAVIARIDAIDADLAKTTGGKAATKAARNAVRIVNENDVPTSATVRRLGAKDDGVSWSVPAGGSVTYYFADGEYEIFFTFADDPAARFQGNNFNVWDYGVEIKLTKAALGERGLRRVN